MTRAAIIGGAGYIGGELARLLLGHPRVSLVGVTSDRLPGRRLDGSHPNLRGLTDLTFTAPDDMPDHDVLFVATAHLKSAASMREHLARAETVIDLTADYRLADADQYRRYYQAEHPDPGLLGSFTTGLPELFRQQLASSGRISVPGCMATAAILALHPLVTAGLISGRVWVDARAGSSGAGADAGPDNTHAERSGALRVFAPVSHRHEAEIEQVLGCQVSMSATAVEAVRGVQVLCRAPASQVVTTPQVRTAYRDAYAAERFVRIVARAHGSYRLPEPKILAGTNFCDVGFAVDTRSDTVIAVAALDNLVKGGAGNAVQSLNARLGWPEPLGLEFAGLHPG